MQVMQLKLASQLPVNGLILKRYLYLLSIQPGNVSTDRALLCKLFLVELKAVWAKAFIPIQEDKHCLKQLMALQETWPNMKRRRLDRMKNLGKKNEDKLKKFQILMASLCDISPQDVESQLRATESTCWKEDLTFFIVIDKCPKLDSCQPSAVCRLEIVKKRI